MLNPPVPSTAGPLRSKPAQRTVSAISLARTRSSTLLFIAILNDSSSSTSACSLALRAKVAPSFSNSFLSAATLPMKPMSSLTRSNAWWVRLYSSRIASVLTPST
ncbi:hypothetical protein D3C80_1971550 [compost metagenome]